jgi:uncharacterized protein (TIGR03437 family)
MKYKLSVLSAPSRHSPWGIFAQLLLFSFLARAANSPTFFYTLTNVGINGIATDSAGNTYITGTTPDGTSLLTTPGAFQPAPLPAFGQCQDSIGSLPCDASFVVKLDPTGAVLFATYLAGNGHTTANAIAVDQQGNVFVTGITSPPLDATNTFPVTPGAAFTDPAMTPGFIAKLNPSGSQLVYSTFIPGVQPVSIAIDLRGNACITGAGVIPATPGAFQVSPKSSANSSPGVVVKLSTSGSALIYATYLSGSGQPANSPAGSGGGDNPSSIAVDSNGNAFITGWTYSIDFPVTSGAFMTASPGVRSIFLTKLNPQGSGLVYSTYLGDGNGYPLIVKLDSQGTAFIAGTTASTSFPTTPGAMPFGFGPTSGFLTRFSADGSSLIYSTYIPTFNYPSPTLDVDSAGSAVVAGAASYASLPIGTGAFQPEYAGGSSDIYVARFTPAGQLSGSTYLGDPQADSAQGIALLPNGSVVVAGSTYLQDLPSIGVGGGTYILTNFLTNIFPSLTVENAASFVATSVAPGEIVALRGYGIGPTTGVSTTTPTTQLGGVQVSFDKFAAPLFYAQSGQINVQVPWEIAGQTSTTVQISYSGVAPAGTPVVVTPSLPGIFYVNNSDGTRNSPSNPAKPGDFISIYGTGGGTLNSPGVTGQTWGLTAPLSNLDLAPAVFVGGEHATVLYAGSAPGLESGIFQINAQLPSNLSATASLYITIGNASSAAVSIAVATQ